MLKYNNLQDKNLHCVELLSTPCFSEPYAKALTDNYVIMLCILTFKDPYELPSYPVRLGDCPRCTKAFSARVCCIRFVVDVPNISSLARQRHHVFVSRWRMFLVCFVLLK